MAQDRCDARGCPLAFLADRRQPETEAEIALAERFRLGIEPMLANEEPIYDPDRRIVGDAWRSDTPRSR